MRDFDPDKFQGEVCKWSSKNFPKAQHHQPLLGLVEETGELIEALDAYEKLTMFESAPQCQAAIRDALGDAMIYLADYCWRGGFQLMACARKQAEKYPDVKEGQAIIELWKVVAKLSHHHLKNEQKIRMAEKHGDRIQECIGAAVKLLKIVAGDMGMDLTACVAETWEKVSKRDWQKNPQDGKVAPPPAKGIQMEDLKPGQAIWDTL